MKYLLLIHTNAENWGHPAFARTAGFRQLPSDEQENANAQFAALMNEISGSGELVDGQPLADPSTARTVRVRGGELDLTDGPFIEGKEQLAGFFVVDCDSPERALEIAARFPDARFASIEVRPIMDPGGNPDE